MTKKHNSKKHISKKDCQKFAKTLGFSKYQAHCQYGTCLVQGYRCLGKVKYTETKKQIKSPLIRQLSFSTERNDKGCTLNFGKIPVFSQKSQLC